mgnify:CR=1 FL=1
MFLLFNACLLEKNRYVVDLRDLTWEYVSESNILFKGIKKIFRFLACRSIKNSLFVSVTNSAELEYLKSKGVKNSAIKFDSFGDNSKLTNQ